ncbi:MAG: DNA polymerase IV [Treponema sp.]
MSKAPFFFHVDLDAFFASVEQLDNPALCGKPVIVGGTGRRGVVSTCSYEARQYGVHSAMPMFHARKCCPQGIFIHPRMKRYVEKSKEVMTVFNNFSPDVQRISIDEAFLDMTGMEAIRGVPEKSAADLKKIIYETTGLRVSVGAASNKYIAKIASGKSKPDGLLVVPYNAEAAFMRQLQLKEIWGIGEKTRTKLTEAGLYTINDILSFQESVLQMIVGNACGSFLYHVVRGDTAHIFNEERKNRSISAEQTFEYDLESKAAISDVLFQLSSELMYRLIDEKLTGNTVHIKIRYADFATVTAQSTGGTINDSTDLYHRFEQLFFSKYINGLPVRLIGAGIGIQQPNTQLELFSSEQTAKKRKVEEAVCTLTKKNTALKMVKARLLKS